MSHLCDVNSSSRWSFEEAISAIFFEGFPLDKLRNQELPSPFVPPQAPINMNDFTKVGPGKPLSPTEPPSVPLARAQTPPIVNVVLEELAMAPAKKKRKFDYPEDLKVKSEEELKEFFGGFIISHGDGRFSCNYGQCSPAVTMKSETIKIQHIQGHVDAVLGSIKCPICNKTFTRRNKLNIHKCKQ